MAAALPEGLVLQAAHTGDVDGDGRDDAVVVTGMKPVDPSARRGIVILTRTAGDGWRIAARNDQALPCAACGGAMGDPLAGIDVMPGGFALRLEGGSRELWSATYAFRFDQARSGWVLDSVDRKLLDRATGTAKQAHAGPSETGRLSFEDFDPTDESLAPIN